MDVNLPVFDCVEEIFDVIFIGKRSTVSLESASNLDLFLGGEEFGTIVFIQLVLWVLGFNVWM